MLGDTRLQLLCVMKVSYFFSSHLKQFYILFKSTLLIAIMSSLLQIQRLGQQYRFSEEEMEILLRSHDALSKALSENREVDGSTFLNILAHSSPYTFFFLPGDEIKARMNMILTCILPPSFSQRFWKKHFFDAFTSYDDADKSLNLLVSKLADCGGRSGSEQALSILVDCCCEDESSNVVDVYALIQLCHLLTVASQVLTLPSYDMSNKDALERMEETFYLTTLGDFFLKHCTTQTNEGGSITKSEFVEIAGRYTPMLYHTLSTFVDTLMFHGKTSAETARPFQVPKLHECSEIIDCTLSAGFLLGCLAPEVHDDNGYWTRLYSSEHDGRSLNRLLWNVLGYDGPTLVLIRTLDQSAIFGGFASTAWKVCGFQGESNSFLFQLKPSLQVFRHEGCKENNFMYCNIEAKALGGSDHLPLGFGFGGSERQPRLFITDSFENCIASSFDGTFEMGSFLPEEAVEKFDVGILEIWAVGGDSTIVKGKKARDMYRNKSDMLVLKARTICDKSTFVEDLASGIIPTKLYAHHS